MNRLLIVDDEPAIRKLIVKYALFEGYEIDEASNGMEALEKCADKAYDLVILDIMMPEMDGFTAARELKKHSPSLPLLMLSARGTVSVWKRISTVPKFSWRRQSHPASKFSARRSLSIYSCGIVSPVW